MPDILPSLPPGTHYRDGWVWPIADERGWPVIREEAAHIGEILAHVPADRRRVAVQAGGNCGLMVRPLADAFETVLTFEPHPLNFRCLEHNVPEESVEKVNGCIGERGAPDVALMAAPDNCGVVRPATEAEGGVPFVPVYAIDDLGLRDLDLLMLDIEGYELHALRGAAETIERCKPVVVLELCGHARVYGTEDIEIVGWLGERGYVCRERLLRDSVFVWEPD